MPSSSSGAAPAASLPLSTSAFCPSDGGTATTASDSRFLPGFLAGRPDLVILPFHAGCCCCCCCSPCCTCLCCCCCVAATAAAPCLPPLPPSRCLRSGVASCCSPSAAPRRLTSSSAARSKATATAQRFLRCRRRRQGHRRSSRAGGLALRRSRRSVCVRESQWGQAANTMPACNTARANEPPSPPLSHHTHTHLRVEAGLALATLAPLGASGQRRHEAHRRLRHPRGYLERRRQGDCGRSCCRSICCIAGLLDSRPPSCTCLEGSSCSSLSTRGGRHGGHSAPPSSDGSTRQHLLDCSAAAAWPKLLLLLPLVLRASP